jgi:diphthine-ammonia ligase
LHSDDPITPVGLLRIHACHVERKSHAAADGALDVAVEVVEVTEAPPPPPPPSTAGCNGSDHSEEEPAPSSSAIDRVRLRCTRGSRAWTLAAQYAPSTGTARGCAEGANGDGDLEETVDTQAQMLRCLWAIERELAESGLGWTDALFMSLYVADMTEFSLINAAYSRVLPATSPPARCCVQVPLPYGVRVCVAALVRAPRCSEEGCTRQVLHVQSVSCWAPSCIGPYAQCVAGACPFKARCV